MKADQFKIKCLKVISKKLLTAKTQLENEFNKMDDNNKGIIFWDDDQDFEDISDCINAIIDRCQSKLKEYEKTKN